jgi:hypothetical protein
MPTEQMPQYCFNIEQSNPESTIHLDIISESQFRRVFVSYATSTIGFSHYLPLLGIDGIHLKTHYQGILLTAIGVKFLRGFDYIWSFGKHHGYIWSLPLMIKLKYHNIMKN